MKQFNSRPPPVDASAHPHAGPASCPACASSSILTTAKIPDADSYWRCTSCGEVWNNSRRQNGNGAGYGGRSDYFRSRL
jgi:predicted Zn finger-like uncharacterized protein